MISYFRLRFRGSFLVSVLGLLVFYMFFCYSTTIATPTKSSKTGLLLSKPLHLRNQIDFGAQLNRLVKRSAQPPTSDDDFQYTLEHRRGVINHSARALIFKTLILVPLAIAFLVLFTAALAPIPVISSPIGRSFESSSISSQPFSLYPSMQTWQMAREILNSEECIERISCEMSRISRLYDSTSWIPSTLEKLLANLKWSERILRSIKEITPSACFKYICTPAKSLKQVLKML